MLSTVFGVVVLGLALFYGLMRSRKMSQPEKNLSERETAKVYQAEEAEPGPR